MINSVDEFMEEFAKHKDKVTWYLHAPTPFADHTQIRGRDVLCSPMTVMCTPPVHVYLDFIDLEADIHHTFVRVISAASDHSLYGLKEAVEKFPVDKFPMSRAPEALELRIRLLEVLGIEDTLTSKGGSSEEGAF